LRVLITGATGSIGRRLAARLLAIGDEVRVVGRDRERLSRAFPSATPVIWDGLHLPAESLDGVDVVFHLAGEPVAGHRWTEAHKRRVRESRVESTRAIVASMRGRMIGGALVCASAVGIYGARGDEVLTEASAPGEGFLAEVCVAWEREANAAATFGTRVVNARMGIVLDRDGGALARMLPVFRTGLAGRLGDGKQWMPWIHIDDVVGLLIHAAKNDAVTGPMNVAAPAVVTNAEFTRVLARTLGRPAFFAAPSFALRAVLGEMAHMILGSQRVVPEVAKRTHYVFRHTELAEALASVLELPITQQDRA